jgi:hypothetical protein
MSRRSMALLPAAMLALGMSMSALAAPADAPQSAPAPTSDPGVPARAAPPGEQVDASDVTVHIGFTPAMKDSIRTFYKGKGCPKGEAAPQAGCIPRTDPAATPRYRVGKPLPGSIEVTHLPKPLAGAMIAPRGYRFGLVDGDVLMLAEDDKRVADRYPAIDPAAP